ncbi:MAG: hypothetical protein E7J58_09695 [Bacillota bacterium]|nr:hypothetical protein [Bacillota bacterium]
MLEVDAPQLHLPGGDGRGEVAAHRPDRGALARPRRADDEGLASDHLQEPGVSRQGPAGGHHTHRVEAVAGGEGGLPAGGQRVAHHELHLDVYVVDGLGAGAAGAGGEAEGFEGGFDVLEHLPDAGTDAEYEGVAASLDLGQVRGGPHGDLAGLLDRLKVVGHPP